MTALLLAWTLLSAVSTSAPANGEQIYPGYRWLTLGDGIYVHTQADPLAGPVDGNSTILVNEEDVVVVDTHINPAVARAVAAKIREITDKPVRFVVNTHWHDDHTNGNHAFRQVFPEATFVAHRATDASLAQEWEPLEASRKEGFRSVEGRDLLAEADALQGEDPARARRLRVYAGYRDALEPELGDLELVDPDLVFDDRLELQREGRRIVVQWLGRGNTDGDAMVWLPDDGVLVTGDVLVWPVPFAFDSPMVEWVETLRRAVELGATTIVPGHGRVQSDDGYLKEVIALLEATVEAVRRARDAGVTHDSLVDEVDLAELERRFTDGDPQRAYAWRSYFLEPGLASAWASLGFPVPAGEDE